MHYVRAKRRQNCGEKKGINRVFFLANRAEKQGWKNGRVTNVANAPKNRKRAVFRTDQQANVVRYSAQF